MAKQWKNQIRRGFSLKTSALFLLLPFSLTNLEGLTRAEPKTGLRDNTPRIHALTGATVVTAPGKVLENGVVILRDRTIEAVGYDLALPPEARIWDYEGKTIYAGFIDSYTQLGLPKVLRPLKPSAEERVFGQGPPPKQPQPQPEGGAEHWNPMVTPQRIAAESIEVDAKETAAMRELGFATALTAPARGVFRGQASVLNLSGRSLNNSLLEEKATQILAFELSPNSSGIYPNSLMGSTALIRQTFHDARWYSDAISNAPGGEERIEANAALAGLTPAAEGRQTVLFATEDELDYGRVARIAREFGLSYALLGNGHEYRKTDLLREMGAPVILPLNFPTAPPVDNPARALEITLESLQHWESAPGNAAALAEAGIDFSLTANFLKSPRKKFWKNVRRAVTSGLEKQEALAALTTNPAELLGLEDRLGSIEAGKIANLVVVEGDLFADEKSKILTVWIDGDPYPTKAADAIDPRGTWALTWAGVEGPSEWQISGRPENLKVEAEEATFEAKTAAKKVFAFPPATLFGLDAGIVRTSAHLSGKTLLGTGTLPDGSVFSWTAERTEPWKEKEEPDDAESESEPQMPSTLASTAYPAGAYGISGKPDQPATILIRKATIWTSGPRGVLEKTDMLVEAGKIISIGPDLGRAEGAVVIEAEDKHLTPGLIDAHSHTAIARRVNEATHAVTLEVRIGDALDPTDIGLYRELAGGLTTANLLHGSANPMGGQNQVIKLRWGEDAEGLKFRGAIPGVKFALGENVKQSNWGGPFTTRYPQTRMGVDQIMRDTFRAARDYERTWQNYASNSDGPAPRKNLRLEAALEILRRERIIHIHSYRQDEILTFARLAKEMGIAVGTFQHILEGYKVADEIAAIGAGGSTFSDWWAYKFEVYDAIPYNGALMHENGVVTSFNSDDNELARHLNTEAAKAVKYGGVSEEEALKFVTLNAAKQLRINQWVGSLEAGKDADFVLWNGHPLSSYSRADQTWIEGRKYFDRDDDAERRKSVMEERQRLIQKALATRLKKGGRKKSDDHGNGKKEEPSEPGAESEEYFKKDWSETGLRSIYHNGESVENCSNHEAGVIY